MGNAMLKEYPPYVLRVSDAEELQMYIDAMKQDKFVEGCIILAIDLNTVKDDTTYLATVTLQDLWHG